VIRLFHECPKTMQRSEVVESLPMKRKSNISAILSIFVYTIIKVKLNMVHEQRQVCFKCSIDLKDYMVPTIISMNKNINFYTILLYEITWGRKTFLKINWHELSDGVSYLACVLELYLSIWWIIALCWRFRVIYTHNNIIKLMHLGSLCPFYDFKRTTYKHIITPFTIIIVNNFQVRSTKTVWAGPLTIFSIMIKF
jgi:hypothetical protein